MKRISSSLLRCWFAEAPAERLSVLRILIGLFALGYLLPRYGMFMRMSDTPAPLFEPVGVAAWLTQPLPTGVFQAILLATLVANVAFVLGWKFRVTGPAFGLLLLFTLCYRNSWSMIFHNDNALVLHVLVLGFTAAADAYSLDKWMDQANPSSLLWPGATGGWQYGWPVKLICVLTAATYFLSGIAKVAGPTGFDWATGSILRDQIAIDALRKVVLGSSASPAVYSLYNQSLLFMLLGAGTLVIELGAPFALANRRLAVLWAGVTFLMHWGILFIMGITFRYQLTGVMFAPYFKVEYLPRWVQQKMGRIGRLPAEAPTPVDA